mmetsp:Transcript_31399/g.79342  ORF Transcript_31399/g.79342 Transcript_31399/m.79342 type:complete len:101 (+) Transcript_31399:218-520(+)
MAPTERRLPRAFRDWIVAQMVRRWKAAVETLEGFHWCQACPGGEKEEEKKKGVQLAESGFVKSDLKTASLQRCPEERAVTGFKAMGLIALGRLLLGCLRR